MNRTLYLYLIAGLSVVVKPALGQGISPRDSKEIKLLAQRKIEKGLNDFLNILTTEDVDESQRREMIARSHADTLANRLFYNTDVIIEDDLLPDRAIDQPVDLKLEKYLGNLDLFYSKSTDFSIVFSDIKVSAVKERVYTYVKVFYTQLFKGKSSQSTAAFRPVPRVAEVRAQRVGKKWTVTIAQIGFPQPGDTPDSPINNVILVEPAAPVDSAAILAKQEQEALMDAQRAKDVEQEQLAQQVYKEYLAKGDKAFAAKDYQSALQYYGEAQKRKLSPDDVVPSVKLAQVKRFRDAGQIADRELLREYRERADLARKKRQYDEALSYYHKILDKHPDSTALINVIKDLTQKSNIKTEYDEQFASGQYEKLVAEYDKIIKKDETNSDWYLGRARCYLKLGKDDRALKDLTRSLELDYANLATLLTRAELYRKLGNLPKAVTDYSAYLIIDPKNDNIFAQRAQVRVRTNNLTSADADFTQAIALNSQQAAYYYDRGLLRYRTQKYDDAVVDLGEAIKLAPAKAEPYFWRGLIYASQKQYALVGPDFANAITNKVPADYAVRIDSVVFSLYSAGQQANAAKNYSQAVQYLTSALAVRSGSPKTLYERGLTYFNQRAYTEAIDDLTASIALAPSDKLAYDKRAEAYMVQHRYELAAADYRKASALDATDYAAMLGEATALIELTKFGEAIPPLTTIKTNQKKIEKSYAPAPLFFRDTFFRLGQAEYATGQAEKAVEDYSTALKFEDTFAAGFFSRGVANEALGKLDRAVEDYQHAIDLNPTVAVQYFAKAGALEKKGDFTQAAAAYTDVMRVDSARTFYGRALLHRGTSYLLAGQYADALNDLNQPTVQTDTVLCQYDCWLNTGTAYLFAGKPDSGLPYLSRCLQNPAYAARAAYATACANLQKDNEPSALTWFEKAFQDKTLTAADVRKDKLIDVARKDFRRNKAFRQLVDKYAK